MATVLQFSGGKDSLACLYLLRPQWNDITVAWTNSGAAFPETIEYMDGIKDMVPHFLEIKGRQTIDTLGYPADVLPMRSTSIGRFVTAHDGPIFQTKYTCCSAAIWEPMARAMKDIGATTVIRGQKDADDHRSPVRSGDVVDGVTYLYPIQSWTDADVYRFLEDRDVELPPNYGDMNTGLDCWNCTAYLNENIGKFGYMKRNHPEKYSRVMAVLGTLDAAIKQETSPLHTILGGH